MARRPAARARRPGERGTTASRSASIAILRLALRRTEAEAWAHAGALAHGVTVGAPPDPFSVQGQNWCLPAPNPVAGAREGWTSLSAVYRANMRHAGMLRIDHAMGLQRLFLIPDGARPADGAYLSYPLGDLLGHIALESERAQCMVVGEDLGTVPDGFRDRLTDAKITGMRVLWFERKGVEFAPPASYPPTSVACVATHDLATLAGWWQGADIAERLALGLFTLAQAGEAIAERREEKRALLRALAAAGLTVSQREDGPLPDATAAAVHALIGGSSSMFAHAQYRRPRWRNRRDQFAGNGPRAPQLASQVGSGCRRRLRQPSGAVDPRGAGQGARVTRPVRL